MSEITAREAFSKMGENFMTPEVIEYLDLENGRLVELSEGRGFDNEPIYGVTILYGDGKPDHENSEMFRDLDEAKSHIKEVENL